MGDFIVSLIVIVIVGWFVSRVNKRDNHNKRMDNTPPNEGKVGTRKPSSTLFKIGWRKHLLDIFGEREISGSLSLKEKNKDVINMYLQKLSIKTPIDDYVRDCINDMACLEGDYFVNNNEYDELNREEYAVNEEYVKLGNYLFSLFERKYKQIEDKEMEQQEIRIKLEKEQQEIRLRQQQKEREIQDKRRKENEMLSVIKRNYFDIEKAEDIVLKRLKSDINKLLKVYLGDDLLYYNGSEGYVTMDELLEDFFYSNTVDQVYLIDNIIDKILQDSLDKIDINSYIDKSSLKELKKILSPSELSKDRLLINIPSRLDESISKQADEIRAINQMIVEKINYINGVSYAHYNEVKGYIKDMVDSHNSIALNMIQGLKNKKKEAIEDHSKIAVLRLRYDNIFKKDILLEYNEDNRILMLEYVYPDIETFPDIKEIKVSAKGVEKEIKYSRTALVDLYDKYLTSACIRIVYELSKNDYLNNLDSISFNGRVDTINKATGKNQKICVMSIQIKKEDILDINLKRIDPKLAFRNFKGISASTLSTLTAIRPIMTVSRKDKRFVEGYNVMEGLDERSNLAIMDRQDFENLIRELFGKIYSKNGGEVKVTQASRDGGIDAVAFDPDPIKGGKVVIQAKRYTNVVGVSAVRDLYGAVHNEGALKGILVTTSYFGSDAYEFAKDKPITLISGPNLLSILEDHGYHVKIDIKEAKKLINEKMQNHKGASY